jgi:acyl-coenzyme A thioesterase PaaI-like protein
MSDAEAPAADEVEKILQTMVPMLGSMGMEVLEAARARVRSRLSFGAQNGNHIGTVYAGVLFSFLEATGGALVLVSFDVSRWIPVIVEGTIRYTRPATGPITCDLSLTDDERDLVHRALELDPKTSWTLMAAAVDEDGRVVCEADLVYRFRTPR